MIFPIHIRYRFKPGQKIENDDNNFIKYYIEQEFIKLNVDKFVHNPKRTVFKNSLFNGQGRMHIFGSIDGGYFECLNQIVTISFSTLRMGIIALLMALPIGLASNSILSGVFIFSWLYGGNLIIFLFRVKNLINRLKKGIEKLEFEDILKT